MKNHWQHITAGMLLGCALLLISGNAQAQDNTFRAQAWRYGIHLGVNANSASLGYQDLYIFDPGIHNFNNPNPESDKNVDGKGLGGYGGAFVEYLSTSWWGVQFRASWDMRDAEITDEYTVPKSKFITRMSYISIEPAIRFDQHLIRNLSFTVGPLIAVNMHGTFDFKRDHAGDVTAADQKVPDRPVASLGVTAGVAYDIEASRSGNSSFYVSPFFDYSFIAAQRKSVITRSQNSTTDIWSTQTFRAGIRLSWESRKPEEKITEAPYVPAPRAAVVEKPAEKMVYIVMPRDNTVVTKNIKGYFSILPYVFYEKDNVEIPARYIKLSNGDAGKFRETDNANYVTGEMTVQETNVDQLMVNYYNVLNIYGDRMRKNPKEQLTLRGCDPVEKDGEACALKVKNYLVDNYGIKASRITIIVEPPRKPSGSALTNPEFTSMIDDENRRVVFVFSNQDMYKPVQYTIRDESSIDNDLVFNVRTSTPFSSWTVSIAGENQVRKYGPYTTSNQRINASPIMRGLDKGSFTATTVVTMPDGRKITEKENFNLRKEKEVKNASRYLMVFDYNKADAVATYETKIRKEITPGMNVGNTVIVHGHTDIIGNEEANQKLSQERANEAKRIIDDQLGKDSKNIDVQAIGIGQTNMQYTFQNSLPEGRMYNRNVFVEVIE